MEDSREPMAFDQDDWPLPDQGQPWWVWQNLFSTASWLAPDALQALAQDPDLDPTDQT